MDVSHVASTKTPLRARRKERQWAKDSLDFENISNKICFRSFEWEKTNFTTFGHPLEKIWKNPLVAHLWKKSVQRPYPFGPYLSTFIAYL